MTDQSFLKLCETGTTEEIELALLAGANIDARGPENETAIMHAVAVRNSPEVISFLIRNGADVNARDSKGLTVLAWSMICVMQGDAGLELLTTLLDNGADANAVFSVGNRETTALMLSVMFDRADIVEILLEHGTDVDVDFRDANGRTALMRVIFESNIFSGYSGLNLIKMLINYGADVNAADADGTTPLMFAVMGEGCDPEIIKALIDAGADVNARNRDDTSVLMWSIENRGTNFGATVSALIRTGGFNANAECSEGLMLVAAIYAAARDRVKIEAVEILLSAGADITKKNKSDTSILTWAVYLAAHGRCNPDVIVVLLDAGAEVERDDRRVIERAMSSKNLKGTEALRRLADAVKNII